MDAASLIEGLGENLTGAAFVLGNGKTNIFVRADIDALKTSSGPQHLCGHSTHTAALMGAYHWLHDHENELSTRGKKVTFVFQPAEETYPSGARTFLDTQPEIFKGSLYGFGIHIKPDLPVGSLLMQKGATWAANDIIQITVKGRAAHIKDTPNGIDAIDGAARIVRLFRELQGDFHNFGSEIVFNFNVIQGGVSSNSIADTVFLKGALRWINKQDQLKVRQFFYDIPDQIAKVFPGSVSIEYIEEVPPACVNDGEIAEEVADFFETNTDFTVFRDDRVNLGSEDFAYYSKLQKTLFSHIGIESPHDLHDPRMEVSDEATLHVYQYWRNLLRWWIFKQM